MRKMTRAAAVVSTGVLTLGVASVSGGGVAGAAPSRACHYPPGACQIYFNHGSYHRGATVKFASDPAFGRHEKIDGKLHCRHGFSESEGPFRSHSHRGIGSFTLPNDTPKGTCTFRLTGRNTGNEATGSFRAKH